MIFIGYHFHGYFDWLISEISKIKHFTTVLIWIIIGLIITRVVDYVFKKVHPEECFTDNSH